MARKPKTGTAVANWEQEMADAAKAQVASEDTAASAGGRFFSIRAGVLQFDDAPLPGNQICAVILDSMMENVYYEGKFDADNRTPPTCFGFGRDADTISVHEEVFKHTETFTPQCGPDGGQPDNPDYLCDECPMNEWGTADTGKGKACQNRRRLAIIPGGTYKPLGKGGGFDLDVFEEPAVYRDADIAYMKLPVMSVKGFSTYLKSVAEQFDRPLFGVLTRIYVEPDPKSQFRVKFELIEVIEDADIIQAVLARHKQAMDEIAFPYLPRSDDDEPATGGRARSNNKLSRQAGPARKKAAAKKPAAKRR